MLLRIDPAYPAAPTNGRKSSPIIGSCLPRLPRSSISTRCFIGSRYRIDPDYLRFVLAGRPGNGLREIRHKIARRPADHVIVSRLELYGQPGHRVVQLQHHREFFFRLQLLKPLLRKFSSVPPTMKKKAGGETAVGILLDFRENLVKIRGSLAAADR